MWNSDKKNSIQLLVYLIETSPFLRKIQMKNLCNLNQEPELEKEYESKYSGSIKISWLTDITQLPHNEAVHFFAANEFFDALPVHKFQVAKIQK